MAISDLLYKCTVRIDVTVSDEHGQGTGFFVAPGLIITCAHVINLVKEDKTRIKVHYNNKTYSVDRTQMLETTYPDLALLQIDFTEHPCIFLNADISVSDLLFAYGYPSKYPEGQSFTLEYEGPERIDPKKWYLKLKSGQVVGGYSGSPLLNMRTDSVCGIVNKTRDEGIDLGGHGISASVILDSFPELIELQNEFHKKDTRWKEACKQQTDLATLPNKYIEWFRDEYQPPGWSRAYSPKIMVNELTLDSPDKLRDQIIAKRDAQLWLVVGDESEGREALLRRVANTFVRNVSSEKEDYYDLPVWCPPPPYQNKPVDPVRLVQVKLKENTKRISASDTEQIIGGLRDAVKNKRTLFVVDGVDVNDIQNLQQGIFSNGPILAGVSKSVAAQIADAQPCLIVELSDKDRRDLAAYWLSSEQMDKWGKVELEFLPLASRPLDVSIWCRAQVISECPIEDSVKNPAGHTETRVELLNKLVNSLLSGQSIDDHPRSHGVQKGDNVKVFLAKLAYLALIDGVETIEPNYIKEKIVKGRFNLSAKASIDIAQIADQCGILQKVTGETYRFTHEVLQEYLAASAMNGRIVESNLIEMSKDAFDIINKDQITKWSHALALWLDDSESNEAYKILGTFLNYKLPEGYGMQFRNNSGPLRESVCNAILHSERLIGEELRKDLGWIESPKDWTGYRPDDWRDIEERLRYLTGVASRIRDDESLTRLMTRFIQRAGVIDIALVRYSLGQELKKRKEAKEKCEKLEQMYKREQFFELAGHSCKKCDEALKKGISFHAIDDGWFLMGAPEAEERSWPNERPRHRVYLDKYWMAVTEVTNEQYEVFDEDHEAYRLSKNDNNNDKEEWGRHPVVRVSWYEAWCFAEWMGMKLPTEAQWEKAARGQNFGEYDVIPENCWKDPMPYWFSNDEKILKSVACFKENSGGQTAEADKQQGNDLLLIHRFRLDGFCGNAWEWCMDEQGFSYTKDDRINPEAFEKRSGGDIINNRIIRGGSYDSPAWNCRHAARHYAFPTVRADTIGFRLCTESLPN